MPTTLENIETVYGMTEDQYLELQELAAEEAEGEEAEEAEEKQFDAELEEEDLELPF